MNIQLSEISLLLNKFLEYFPRILISSVVILVGWLMAILIRFLVSKILELIKLNVLADKIGVTEILKKGKIDYTASRLAGIIFFWLMIMITLFTVADIAGISVLEPIFEKMSEKIPSIVSSMIIFIVGGLTASFLGNFVQTVANNAAFPHPGLFSKGTKYAAMILVIILAFENLKIGSGIISYTFLIILAAVTFGIALAFGLGCKEIARDLVDQFIRNLEERNRKGPKGPDLEG
ncbi:MAG: hypothetical protein V1752_00305 [Candidatus Firestonebacteria bacterium]